MLLWFGNPEQASYYFLHTKFDHSPYSREGELTMTKKFVFTLLVLLGLTLSLSACRMSASKVPAVTATTAEDFPFPVVTTQPDVVKDIQTQTAVATGVPTIGEATATVDNQVGGGVPSEKTIVETATATVEVVEPTSEPVSIPTVTRPSSYTLQKGEWPICIARRFDVNLGAMFQANGLNMNSRPATGTTLVIPAGNWNSGSRALKNHPTTYTVQAGDTIYTVACAFGDVDPSGIIAANGLSSPYSLSAGQTLQIP
jgi:LysM repeat protein